MGTSDGKQSGRWGAAVAWMLVAGGLTAAYAQTFMEMWRRWFPAWHRPNLGLYDRVVQGESYYTHGPLVPLVSLLIVVLLIRHVQVPARPRRFLGGLVVGGSLFVHLLACLARVNFVSGFTVIGVVVGLVLFVWGATALRRLWFPIAFLAFMVPLPEVSVAQLNFHLKMLAAEWGVRAANFAGIIVERSGNQVFMEDGKNLVIANVCNGLRTLISLLAFGALYAYVCKLRGIWRLGLFAMTVPVAVVSNSVRIVSLILVTDVWDEKVATGWYHDTSGIFIFVLAFMLMFSLERAVLGLRRIVGRPAEVLPLFHGVVRGPDDETQWPRLVQAAGTPAAWLVVVLVLVAAGGALWLNRKVPPVWNQQMARQAVPVEIEVGGQRWHSYDLEMDETTLTILETRDYLYRRYVVAGGVPIDFCIIFSQDNRKGTHPPDLCLEGGGQDIVAKEDVVIPNVDGPGGLPCRGLVVQLGGNRDYFLYTYKCGSDYTNSFWNQQWTIFLNGLLHRNASGALVRVSTPVGDDLEAAKDRARQLLSVAVPYLDRSLP